MRLRSAALGIACVAVLSLLAMRWMGPEPAADTPLPAASHAVPAMMAAPGRKFFDSTELAQQQATTTLSRPPERWRGLQAMFARATSLRAFYYEALRRPQDGGRYYAERTLAFCIAPKPGGFVSAAQQEARDRMHQLCDFSKQEFQDALDQLRATRNFKPGDDPLYQIAFASMHTSSDSERVALLRAAIDVGPPELIAALTSPGVAASLQTGLPKDADMDWQQMEFVLSLVACRLGADCSPGGMPAQAFCARFGWCAGSVETELRTGLGAGFEHINEIANTVLDNIRKGNIDQLIVPRYSDPKIPRQAPAA